MSLVAWKQPYLLQVMVDDEPENPRGEEDCFGHMVCWHRRYNLGDQHPFENPNDFLKDLVRRTVSGDAILDYVRSGKSHTVRLSESYPVLGEGRTFAGPMAGELMEDGMVSGLRVEGYDRSAKEWYEEEFFVGGLGEQKQEVVDCLVDRMANQDLLTLARKENIILPLYLYDHSGLSISVSGFVGRAVHAEWDSGQVGWIYATTEDIREVYDGVSAEVLERAEQRLKSEVESYDYFLSGQCYGFRLYENGEETESTWGFLGSLPDMKTCSMEYGDIMREIGSEPFAETGMEV